MAARDECGGTRSARRRRERRLHSKLRHERFAVAMALAETLHHSAQKVMEQHTALRGLKKASAGEEVENETHAGLRAQKSPPLGVRPGILPEPGSQRSDRTVRRFAGAALPTPGLPVLAGASGEAVDTSALRFLTRAALEAQEEEARRVQEAKVKEKVKEEEKKLKLLEKEMAKAAAKEEKMQRLNDRVRLNLPLTQEEWAAWYRWNGIKPSTSSSSSGSKRKRKKRRRKRTRRSCPPRLPSCPSCRTTCSPCT